MQKTEAEKLLAKLVSMPTISDDVVANKMMLDYIEDYLAKRGMFTRRDYFDKGYGTLLASTRHDSMLTPTVLLSAHTDVVAADESMFTLQTEGDKLIGRGTFDMKFSIAGYMALVDELKGKLSEYDFGIAIVTDEETVDRGTVRLLENGLKPQICILPDSTAPGWSIETLAKGYWRFELHAKGKRAHGARPWEGESASLKLIHALHELKEHFKGQNPETDTYNVGQIHGGHAHNMVPDEMWAGMDIRYLNDKNLAKSRKIIDDLCNKHDLTFKEIVLAAPVPTDIKEPLIQEYMDSVETVTGKRPENFVSCAGSDAPCFMEAGIPCIVSCCEGWDHHTNKEWISRKSFLQFVPILRDYLDRVARA